MRKNIALIMFLVLLIRIFCLSAVAADSDQTFSKDFSTEQIQTMHRYAVDIEYESMSIPVVSAIWDVNNYYYQVLMGGGIEEDEEGYFDFNITMINHSDLPIQVQITVQADEMDIEKSTKLTNGAQTTEDKHTIPEVLDQSSLPLDQRQPNTSETTISLKPTVGWQSFINTLIANGATNGSSCIVGSVTIAVTKK